ncbi:MAG: PGF-pre-PGF domain-containing protein, partial [Candidatus Micrarchaeaceae archaeon]
MKGLLLGALPASIVLLAILVLGIMPYMQQASLDLATFNSNALPTNSSTSTVSTTSTSSITSTTSTTTSSTSTTIPANTIYYSLAFNSVPSAGTISFNGTTYENGNAIQVAPGNYPINAIAPANFIFSSWISTNSVNLTFANPYSANTNLAVSGNGVVTATFNGITTFSENGLPANTQWNVTYGSITQNTIAPNSISFSTPSGNYTFTVANQVVGNVIYVPTPSSGNVVAGNATSISFANASFHNSSTSTLTTTASTTTTTASTTSTTYSTTTVQPLKTYKGSIGGFIKVNNQKMSLSISNQTLHSMVVNFKQNGISFNISIQITNSSTPNFYKEITIEESNSTVQNIDAYVSSAVYNFSVPASWISQHGISSGNIKLFKQISSSQLVPLSTTLLGYNSVDKNYYYSAVSNSLSTYIVGFTTSNAISTASSITLTSAAGYKTYFWAGAATATSSHSTAVSFTDNWTNVSVGEYLATKSHPGGLASIGFSKQITGSMTSAPTPVGAALAYIGANVIFTSNNMNGAVYTANTGIGQSTATSLSLSYTVTSSNSFVILLGASNYTFPSPTLPGGCTLLQYENESTSGSVFIASCIESSGNSITINPGKAAEQALAAFVFPPYSVTLDDNPISGTITTNGNTYSSGNVIQVIGTNTITANPSPSGSWAFNSWSVSNSVNLSISSLTSNPATFTVMGDGIVTASWNGISKFAESGLPTGTQWSVAFNNITQNSIAPNSIIFSTPPGNYTFSVANVVVGNAIYIPSPQNSLTVAGNSIEIDFAKIFVIFSGEKPVPVSSTNDKLNIIINNNILKGMNIIFNSNINFNMSVNIASPPPNSRFYNEIKIAENKSVDQNVTSVIYNFSVPKSYVNSQNISNSNIKLFKNVSNGWLALPTVYTGSNSTAYFYYATSNSLSTYAVGFTTGNAIGTSTPLSLTLPSGYYTYFFGYGGLSGLAGTTAGSAFSDNWTTSVNYTTTISAKGKAQYNMSNIGYMVQKITGTVSGGTAPINVTLVGVGANVILGNGATYTNSGSSTSLSLSYTVSTSNSFAIIILAAGGSAFSAAPTTTATGCSLSQDISSSTAASAAIFVCNSIAAGSYTASATTTKASAWSAAAYIFPPYSVTLDDIPSTYTITTNGNTYSSGTVIQVIGTNTITANPPAGYEFSHWSVSNIINLTLSSSIANPATLTVMGNGIVTATYAIPTGIPSNILNYTPVTLTYNGLATYPNPFQQFIPVNALNYTQYMTYNSNFANFEYFYENGTIIPAWIESDTSNTLRTWAKVSNTIFSYTGSGTATNTIYLGFASNTLNLLSSSGTSGIGEAPQLSSTYAEYDDGASVFPLYANFAGTSLPSTFAVNKTGSGESYSVNNGLGMTTTSREAATVLLYSSSAYNPADYVGYAGVKTNRNVGNGNPIGFYTNNVISSITGYTIDYGQNNENGSAGVYMQVLNKGTSASINPSITKSITTGNYFIYSYYWEATGEEFAAVNYTISASATNSLIPIGPAYLGERVSVGSGGAQITTNTIWIRLCAAPPNDVMPSSATG